MLERENRARRHDLQEQIFKFSDLLVTAPIDFPDKRYFEHLAAAVAEMLDLYSKRSRESRLRMAIGPLREALALLEREQGSYDQDAAEHVTS